MNFAAPDITPTDTDNAGGLAHIYLPWSALPTGFPPRGARALCGHVRDIDSVECVCVSDDHPDACVVCTDLAERLFS